MRDHFSKFRDAHPGSSARFEAPEGPDGAARISVSGDLDTETTADFLAGALESLASLPDGAKLDLDLGSVRYISSTGVGSLVRLLSAAERRSIALRIDGMSPTCRDVFTVLGLIRYFKLRGDDGSDRGQDR